MHKKNLFFLSVNALWIKRPGFRAHGLWVQAALPRFLLCNCRGNGGSPLAKMKHMLLCASMCQVHMCLTKWLTNANKISYWIVVKFLSDFSPGCHHARKNSVPTFALYCWWGWPSMKCRPPAKIKGNIGPTNARSKAFFVYTQMIIGMLALLQYCQNENLKQLTACVSSVHIYVKGSQKILFSGLD